MIAAMFLISFTLTGLGFAIAWKMDSTAAFHGVMKLLLVPMWMVSGALFPMATAHGAVKAIMWANPDDVFDGATESYAGSAECRPRRGRRAWW